MELEYYYEAFMYVVEDERTLRVTVTDDEVWMYFLTFQNAAECGKYQQMLYKLTREMEGSPPKQQSQRIVELLRDNPFGYQYQLETEPS
ncbi:MAG: hypothetical protein Q4B80_04095 [Aerococcaceae bacterium]|nr:hypothetical protein [Aerococcaceae bacterium]